MEQNVYRQFYEQERVHWWFRGMHHLCKVMILRYGNNLKPEVLLDMGCGTGGLTEELRVFGDVTGVDMSAEALSFCRKRGLKKLIQAPADKTGLPDNSYSLIVAFGLIEHIEDDRLFLMEMQRILKKGGRLIILTSAFQFLWSQHDIIVHHKRRYNLKELESLMKEAGLKKEKYTYVNFLLFHVALLLKGLNLLFLFRKQRQHSSGSPYIYQTNFLVNWILEKILWIETWMLRLINFPYGIGILCVVKKEESESLEVHKSL